MKKLVIVSLLLFTPLLTSAHPGNTDSSGCHTCRTNCAKWGLSYGEYHCHNAKVYTPVYSAPTVSAPVKPVKLTDSDIDIKFPNTCYLKDQNDKYLYRKSGTNYYDDQCSYRLNHPVEEWITTNGLAVASSDIHKWAYWLIKFYNTVGK